MIDIDKIKSQITEDDIISIMDSFGVPFVKQDTKEIIFYSICHHPDDFMEHKPKLYYYIESKSFYCFSCGWSGDIFDLVKKIKSIDFINSINWICKQLNIDVDKLENKSQNIDNWKSMKRFLPYSNSEPIELTIYNKADLALFDRYYHQSWLNDGITKASMDKFHIGWYGRNAQISIPVFDIDDNLIGIHARNTRRILIEKGFKYQPLKTLNYEYKFPTGQVLYGLKENLDAIKSSQMAILFEAPKSVLQMESILNNNISVAMFGWNCQKYKRDLLLDIGVKKVYVAIDKQYENINSPKFDIYKQQVNKIVRLFKPYCQTNVIWDNKELLGYKDSPSDKGKEIWKQLNISRC